MNQTGTGAEFRVRSSWACLITSLIIYPALIIFGGLANWNAIVFAVMLGLAVAVQTIIMIAVHIYLALRMPQEPDDERDKMLLSRASSIAGYVLQSGVFVVLVLMIARASSTTVQSKGTAEVDMLPIYALLGVWIASELVRYVMTITGYRTR